MNKDMLTLYQSLFRDASGYRVSISKLAMIRKKMESNDLCNAIPLLIREIEIHVRRNIKGEEERKRELTSLSIRRNQFLELKEDEARRKGK